MEDRKIKKYRIEKGKEKLQMNKKEIENNYYLYKRYSNFKRDTLKEHKKVLYNVKIQRRYIKKNKYKFNGIYILFFYFFIITKFFFSQFIKCNHGQINLSSSYINLKTIGTGRKELYSGYYKGNKPNIIIINNYTNNEILNTYNFNNPENNINNITLIWNNLLNSTSYMFYNCKNIIDICFLDVHH